MFSNDKFTVYNDTNYKKKYVFFIRFKFDLCSLVAEHIENEAIQPMIFEVILRQVYKSITFYPSKD